MKRLEQVNGKLNDKIFKPYNYVEGLGEKESNLNKNEGSQSNLEQALGL